MFDFDTFREIGATIKKNKLRTTLTGFSIAWGIFMLIVLLGSGNGLRNGISSNFSNRAKNTVSVWGGNTSLPYKGLSLDRKIMFDDKDYQLIKTKLPEVEYATAVISQSKNISYNKNYGTWNLRGVHPDAGYINNIKINNNQGRFINQFDIETKRKVIVVNTEIESILFKGESALGKSVLIGNIAYQVVGIYKDETGRTNVPAYIPFSTAQALYSKNFGFDELNFTVKDLNTIEENNAFVDKYIKMMAALHHFDPLDKSALGIWNTAENAIETASIFNAVTLFIWIVGIASLMAGIVGVGNIMLITVKERTKEFGIRKAIGATPLSVLKLVLLESVVITTIFGYVGMVLGIGLTELMSYSISQGSKGSNDAVIFLNPTVNLEVALLATLVLVIAGVFAGYIPAKRAVSISPIEAMRAE